MQKVEGSNPFSRLTTKPLQTGASSFLRGIGTTPTFALHLGNEFPKWPRYGAIGGDSNGFQLAFGSGMSGMGHTEGVFGQRGSRGPRRRFGAGIGQVRAMVG